MTLAAASFFIVGLIPLRSSAAGSPSPVEALLNASRPLVIAHRGYSLIAPENTLPAFELAKTAGADLVELDYHHSKEGTPVVIHDFDLDRTTDSIQRWGSEGIRVGSRTVAELRALEAGRWFDPHWAGVRLPLLTEALDLIQDGSMTLIERKAGDAETCVRMLRQRGLINRVVVQSFDWLYLSDFHRREPTQVLGALGPQSSWDGRKLDDKDKKLSEAWVDRAQKTGARAVVWNREISRSAVEYAHRLGLKIWVYTIDDSVAAGQLLGRGVDGIISNNPSLIWKAIALKSGNTVNELK